MVATFIKISLFALCPALCAIDLLRHVRASLVARGPSAAAAVGVAFSLILVCCAAAGSASLFTEMPFAAELLARVADACAIWFSISVFALRWHAASHRTDPDGPIDAIIVPGAALAGAEPSPFLASRLDRAIELWHGQDEKPLLVVSGGQGDDEVASEAAAMRSYLLSHGVDANHVLEEDRSTTTFENMRYSRDVLAREGRARADSHVAIVSTDYHLARCLAFARRAGMNAQGVGASSAGLAWSRGYIRETFALAKMLLPSYAVPVAVALAASLVSTI